MSSISSTELYTAYKKQTLDIIVGIKAVPVYSTAQGARLATQVSTLEDSIRRLENLLGKDKVNV